MHTARIDFSLGDGVQIGSCATCGESVVRINPRTGHEEWLGTFDLDGTWRGGISPWTTSDNLLRVENRVTQLQGPARWPLEHSL